MARVSAALVLFLLTQYWHALSLPFVGDDFVILERVRDASFGELWRREGLLIFGWYRPISRELHYWALEGLAGPSELAFHLVSFGLWVGVLLTFYRYVGEWIGARGAAIATAGTACLSAWGGPLIWVAGVQDLWMLLFGLLYLWACSKRQALLAAGWLSLALLSKESAVVFPVIATAIELVGKRLSAREAVRLHLPSIAVLAVWVAIHPTFLPRLTGNYPRSLESEQRPPQWAMIGRSVLAVVDLDSWPAPEDGWGAALLRAGIASVALLAILLTALRSAQPTASPKQKASFIAACGVWVVVGIIPPLVPSLGWHAYYSIIGLMGAWAILGAFLADHRRLAILAVLVMALLRAGRATTPTWDWGTEWYQVRAGNVLRLFRADLLRQYPAFPRNARVYFTHVPNNVGFIAGNSPALRIWYNDPTLRAYFFRDFVVRDSSSPAGPDFFFHFDTLRGLQDMKPVRDAGPVATLSPEGERRRYNLATVFRLGGDTRRAAEEYLAIAKLNRGRADCTLYAAACYEVLGLAKDRDAALSLASEAGVPDQEARSRLRQLVASFPGRRSPR